MNKLALLSLLCLTGCGTVQQMQLNGASQRAQAEIGKNCDYLLYVSEEEAQAWRVAGQELEQCVAGDNVPWPQDKMMVISQCGAEAMNSNIRPVSYSKTQFDRYMKGREVRHKKYAAGQISWEEQSQLGMQEMNNYFDHANRGSYFNYTQCSNTILNREVMPSYPNQLKPLFISYMSKMAKFSREADKQHMDSEDFQIGAQELWAEFASAEQQKIGQVNAQNSQAWQNVSKSIMDAETERQKTMQQNTRTMQQTTCHTVAGTLQCTTW